MAEVTKILAGIILSLQSLLGVSSAAIINQPTPTPILYATTAVSVGDTQIQARIADTEAKREQGLSSTTPLAENEGMLFMFDRPDYYKFWMKDMNYPLDIIWLDQDRQIVDISANLAPSTYPQTFQPQKPAKYVLEVKAGFSERHRAKIGDKIKF